MAIELLVTQDLLFSTLIITSVMYSMSMTLTSGDKVLFVISYFWAVFGSMAFMMHLGGGNLAPPSSFEWVAYFMIFVCFASHTVQRFIEHVVLGNEFKLLDGYVDE